MEPKVIYLASPYSHKDPVVRLQRFQMACESAAKLMEEGKVVFSPIAHSHPIEAYGMGEIKDANFWLHQDFAILSRCDEMYVLMLDGWKESYGVNREIDFANERGMKITFKRFEE